MPLPRRALYDVIHTQDHLGALCGGRHHRVLHPVWFVYAQLRHVSQLAAMCHDVDAQCGARVGLVCRPKVLEV